MKKNRLLLMALMLFTFGVNAQNWNFIKSNERYHFQHVDDDIPLNTIFADSTALVGTDSVLYLNRLFLECDTCFVENDYGGKDQYGLHNQPGFLQRSIVRNGFKIVLEDPDSLTIYLPGSDSTSWWFDGGKTLRASIDTVVAENLWGKSDSVVHISINGAVEIKIAKQLGLIKYFDYYLSGLEDAQIGITLPTWKDFYDFEVGDEFDFRHTSNGGGLPPSSSISKRVVRNIESNDTSIVINWKHLSMGVLYGGGYNQWSEREVILKETFANCYPQMLVHSGFENYYIPEYRIGSWGLELVERGSVWYTYDEQVKKYVKYEIGDVNYEDTYVAGLGKINKLYDSNMDFSQKELIAYKKGDSIQGDYFSESILNGDDSFWKIMGANEELHFLKRGEDIPLHPLVNGSDLYYYPYDTNHQMYDTTYMLNKHNRLCDNCQGDSGKGNFNFLGDAYKTSPLKGKVEIYGEDTCLIYFPNSGIEEWIFNANKNLSAKSLGVNVELVLGLSDTVYSVAINGKVEVKISKQLGVVQYFDYSLAGVRNKSLGECLPNYKDIYAIEIGDVFQYQEIYKKSDGSIINTIEKHEVYWVEQFWDGVEIRYYESKVSSEDDGDLNYLSKRKSLSYEIDRYHVLNAPFYSFSTANNYLYNYSKLEQGYQVRLDNGEKANQHYEVYEEGLGEIEDYRSFVNQGYSIHRKLIGWIKAGEEKGEVYSDEFYTITSINESILQNLKITPNPSQGEISFELGNYQQAQVKVYTLQGKQVEQFVVENNQTQNLQHLNAGIYLITIEVPEGVQQIKWVKQ